MIGAFPWEDFRKVIVTLAHCADDYVTIDGAGEAVVQPNYAGASLTWRVRVSPRQVVGQGRADKTAVIETIGGKDYRVVTQSGHDGWRLDLMIESFDKETYAGDVSREIARGFEDEGTHAQLSDLNLSVSIVGDSADVTFVREGQELSASSLDLLVYHKWQRVDRTARELIETIDVRKVP
jgi:hypothetical protein